MDNRRYKIKELQKLFIHVDDELDRLLVETVHEIIHEIGKGESAGLAVQKILSRVQLSEEMYNIIYPAMVKACTLGYDDIPPNSNGLHLAWAKDEETAVKRLDRLVYIMEAQALGGIQSALNLGTSVRKIAEELADTADKTLPKYLTDLKYMDKYLRSKGVVYQDIASYKKASRQVYKLARNGAPTSELKVAYEKVLKMVEGRENDHIEEAIKNAMIEKGRYNATRIARTEMARAYVEGEYARYIEDEDIVGVRWKLSDRHPVFDICDLYANADLYGMGKGVYPKDEVPFFPAHPHCMCHLEPVYSGEVPKGKARIKKGVVEFLTKASEYQQEKILGVRGAKRFQETGKFTLDIPIENPKIRVLHSAKLKK